MKMNFDKANHRSTNNEDELNFDFKMNSTRDHQLDFSTNSNRNSSGTNISRENCSSSQPLFENSSLSELLYNKLKQNDFENALKILKKSENKNYLKYHSLDIVPIISRILQEEFCTIDTEFCIEEILDYIALIANQKEALLVFLEEVEIFRSTKQFRVMLKPLQTILLQQVSPTAKANMFSWVFTTVNDHASALPLPKYDNLEGNERKLLDADPDQEGIAKTYSYILDFYEPFFTKVIAEELAFPEKDVKSGEYLSYFLLRLLDKPLAFLDIYKTEEDTESGIFRICAKFVHMISLLIKNPYKYIDFIKVKSIPPQTCEKNDNQENDGFNFSKHLEDKLKEKDTFQKCEENDEVSLNDDFNNDSSTKVSQLSLAVYFYCVLGQAMNESNLPCVYAMDHIYFKCFPLCLHLFEQKSTFTVHKGLVLFQSLLSKIENNSLSQDSLEVTNHYDVVQFLIDIMTQCDQKEFRILALKCFKDWMQKFNNEGKYRLFYYILSSVSHIGLLGVVIHELKETIRKSSDLKFENKYFSGLKLQILLKLACSLPEDETTDLLEWNDKIMAALNLLIYVCLLDKNDDLNFRPILPSVIQNFLVPIQNGLRITIGHYNLKLKDLEKGKNKDEPKMNIKILGDTFSGIPVEEQKELIQQSLNWLDVMHSTWARANKLVVDFKNKDLSICN